MSDLGALASMRWVELRNRVRKLKEGSRFKFVVIGLFCALFWISLYLVFLNGLKFINSAAFRQAEMVPAMLDIFFFSLTLMLVFSNAIISYSSFYKARETGFLHAAPVRPESVFLYKLGESVAFSSWAFLFLATPLMVAYANLEQIGALPLITGQTHVEEIGASRTIFLAGSALFVGMYVFLPAVIGAIVAMLITTFIPRTRKALIWACVLVAAVPAALLVTKILKIRGGYSADARLAEVLESTDFTRNPILPSYWISHGIHRLRQGGYGDAAFFLGVVAANVLFLMTVGHWLASSLMMKGWFVSQGLRNARRYPASGAIDWVLKRVLFFSSGSVRVIVVKDVKSFIRDPVQWSQFLIFFGLLGIYFLNLRSFGYGESNLIWKNIIAQMNLLATSLTLATFSNRFIFPQLSLEGRRFWVLGMAPMEREKILFGKLALSFTSSLVISEVLILVSSVMLRTPTTLAVLHAVAMFGICLGLSGLAVGLGALYPNFSEDNPSKIVAGFGGTLNLVLSLGFVLAVLAAEAYPCFLYFGRAFLGPQHFQTWIVLSMVGIAAISLTACLVPMSLGLKAIQRLEI